MPSFIYFCELSCWKHKVDDKKTVGAEAFSRIAPACPVIADVATVHNLFDVLTSSSGSRLHFLIYDKYLRSLEKYASLPSAYFLCKLYNFCQIFLRNLNQIRSQGVGVNLLILKMNLIPAEWNLVFISPQYLYFFLTFKILMHERSWRRLLFCFAFRGSLDFSPRFSWLGVKQDQNMLRSFCFICTQIGL